MHREALGCILREALPARAEDLAERGAGELGFWPEWMVTLSFAVVAEYRVAPVEHRDGLVRFIVDLLEARAAQPPGLGAAPSLSPRRACAPGSRHRWPVTPIESVIRLAQELELSSGQLAWLAVVRGWERTVTDERLRNYRYRWTPRRSGLPRLIEAPKLRLKEIQRRTCAHGPMHHHDPDDRLERQQRPPATAPSPGTLLAPRRSRDPDHAGGSRPRGCQGETPGEWGENVGSERARRAAAARDGYGAEFDLRTYFMHDIADDLATEMHKRAATQLDESFDDPCTFDGRPAVPIHVVAGRDDRFFPLEFQQRVARDRLDLEAA